MTDIEPAAATAKRLCAVYRSSLVDGMYLYVDLQEGLKRVPESLLARFGTPQPALRLTLYPGRRLARVDVERVMAALDDPGYFLQMPPPRDPDLLDLHREPVR